MPFTMLDENQKRELQEGIRKIIADQKEKNLDDGFSLYRIKFKDKEFGAIVSEDELDKVSAIAIEMAEELKNINNSGMTRAEVAKLDKKIADETNVIKQKLEYPMEFYTERMNDLIIEAANTMRVGGTYYMLVAKPLIISAILAVYRVIVDKFDDEELYDSGVYMLARMILKMHEIALEE